jgi:alpha-beta hydrolase superfamily lysophospholipase
MAGMCGMGLSRGLGALLLLCVAWAGLGCAGTPVPKAPLGQQQFADYQAQTRRWLAERRAFVSPDAEGRAQELDWNSPREWRPSGLPRGGVLLVHGLGDSPWSWTDVGAQLAAQGWLVRSVLLPGHGSRPADLLPVQVADWQQVVAEQVGLLRRDLQQSGAVARLWLGGFSTGANLILAQAYGQPEIEGLLLFSPAFKAGTRLVALAPLVKALRPWLASQDPAQRPQQGPVRYYNVPTNGFAQYYLSSKRAQRLIGIERYTKPVLMVLAEHDSVLDVDALRRLFEHRFVHPASRLIWYGVWPEATPPEARVTVRPDHLPDWRISQFSHMGMLFAPDNPVYGHSGSLRLCWNGQSDESLRRCQAGAPIWYSAWGHQEDGKDHARLTFNPYFSWQGEVMAAVMSAAGPSPDAGRPASVD